MGLVEQFKNVFKNKEEKDAEMEIEKGETQFKLDTDKDVKMIDETDKLSDINVKYPLIKPFAYAHIKWDDDNKEIVYYLEEPELNEDDKEAIEMIKQNLSEKLDVSLSGIKDREKVIGYLEKKIDELLKELGVKLGEEQHNKVMYYIYRDFVGLGQIEPFMHDPYIEDLGCDGTDIPIFAVHSEFGSVRTDVKFEEEDELKNLVIKLAERCGKYVSYANPLLDGALQDGSRVNASLTEDVTAHGPTFSIRKFQDTPFSAINMMKLGTANAELLAYMWIMEQYQQSYLICGGTATGKCVAPDDKIHLGNGNMLEAEKLHKQVEDDRTPKRLFTLKDNLDVAPKSVNKFLKLENDGEVYRIRTERGAEITVTPEHPFIVNRKGEVQKVEAENVSEGEFVAAPRKLDPDTEAQKIRPLDHDIQAYAAGAQSLVQELFDRRDQNIVDMAREFNEQYKTVECWRRENAVPWITLEKLIEKDSEVTKKEALNRINGIKSRQSPEVLEIPREVTPEIAALVGYIIADGNIHGNYVSFHNSRKELRERFQELTGSIFGTEGREIKQEDKVDKIELGSKPIKEFLRNVFDIPVDEPKARKVSTPENILKSPGEMTSDYLRALFDAEADVSNKQTEITFTTASKDLAEEVVNLLHRHGIIARKRTKQVEDEIYFRIVISGKEQNQRFHEEIGFTHKEKKERVEENIENTEISHTNVNLIPASTILKKIKEKEDLTNQEIADSAGLARRTVGRILNEERTPSYETIDKISNNLNVEEAEKEIERLKEFIEGDTFWDQIEEIEKIPEEDAPEFVYDVTVDKTHTFTAGSAPLITHNTSFLNSTVSFIPPEDKIVSIEDTRELQLPHENWIPSVTRSMFGTESNSDVDMNQLLEESFRENPDYVIVGEVRGEEASVLFQGMSSGHPSIGTMHASGPNDVVKRLVTPPISLSPALVESLDVIVAMTHAKGVEKSARRVRAVHEIQKVMAESQSARTNEIFSWTARDDSFRMRGDPYLFNEISEDYGVSKNELRDEHENRTKVLKWLKEKGVTEFHKVSKIISEYYKNKEDILKMVNSEEAEYTLDDVIEAESRVNITRPDRLDSEMEADKPGELVQEIKNLDGDSTIEKKKKKEKNPVEEIEKKLRAETEKVEETRESSDQDPFMEKEDKDEEDQDPFKNSGKVSTDPFKA